MPFVEGSEVDAGMDDGGAPFPHIGTDLYDGLSGDEEPLDSGPVIPEILQTGDAEAATAVRLDDEEDDVSTHGNGAAEEEGSDEEDNEDIPAHDDAPTSASAKKRGRPSLGASRTSTPKTPKSSKAAAGRKRKADASADEPAAKRPGRGRATAAAASEAIKQSQEKRPKAANGTKAAPKATGAKRGPKPGAKRGPKPGAATKKEEEYEVEKILEHTGSGKSTKYLVKWKGYEEGDNTWEPKSNLAHATDLLKQYEATAKVEEAAAPAKKAAAPAKTAASAKKAGRPAKKAGRPAKKAAAEPAKKTAAPKKAAAAAKPAGRAGRTAVRTSGRPKRNA